MRCSVKCGLISEFNRVHVWRPSGGRCVPLALTSVFQLIPQRRQYGAKLRLANFEANIRAIVLSSVGNDRRVMTSIWRVALPFAACAALVWAPSVGRAADFVVVGSSDPTIARGQAFDAGSRIALAPGRALTLMHASGALVRLQGSATGALAPRERASAADADRMAVLRFILSDADRPATARTLRPRGICPRPDVLTSLDDIARAQRVGCETEAEEALDAWLNAHSSESS